MSNMYHPLFFMTFYDLDLGLDKKFDQNGLFLFILEYGFVRCLCLNFIPKIKLIKMI